MNNTSTEDSTSPAEAYPTNTGNRAFSSLTNFWEAHTANVDSDTSTLTSTTNSVSQAEALSPALLQVETETVPQSEKDEEAKEGERGEREEKEEREERDTLDADEGSVNSEDMDDDEDMDSDEEEYPDGSPEQNRIDERLLRKGRITRLGQMASAA